MRNIFVLFNSTWTHTIGINLKVSRGVQISEVVVFVCH